MDKAWPGSLVLAGAGKMGSALLRGWLGGGLTALAIHVVDPAADEEVLRLCRDAGVGLGPPPDPADALVLAVKPQTFAAAPQAFAPLAGPNTLVVSILAGTTLASLRAALPHAGAIVRTMPNLPAAVGRGTTAVVAEPGLAPERRAIAETLLRAVGAVEWVEEDLLDAVTAVSGSGPAYVFYLAECLAEAGVAAGLPSEVSARLARATVEGAAALMTQQQDRTPAQLRQAVTSPGGTTAAALAVLRADDAWNEIMTRAVAAAKARAGELAG